MWGFPLTDPIRVCYMVVVGGGLYSLCVFKSRLKVSRNPHIETKKIIINYF